MSDGALTGIDHLAVATKDMKSTLDFYCGVLGIPLGGLFWMHGVEGAVHAFLTFPDGRMLSFIQFAEERPRQRGVTYATWAGEVMPAGTMQHLALQVPSSEALQGLRHRLVEHGVKVSEAIDHDFCVSVYFAGPDDVQLEVTYSTRPLDDREFDDSACSHCGITEENLLRFRSSEIDLSTR